jgi:hypothetical protein
LYPLETPYTGVYPTYPGRTSAVVAPDWRSGRPPDGPIHLDVPYPARTRAAVLVTAIGALATLVTACGSRDQPELGAGSYAPATVSEQSATTMEPATTAPTVAPPTTAATPPPATAPPTAAAPPPAAVQAAPAAAQATLDDALTDVDNALADIDKSLADTEDTR